MEDSFSCATEDLADVRELIPEFYCFLELFININNNNFGVQQTGLQVNHVILPKWADNNPYKFVSILRKVLESEYVSKNLHNWIDLIFGYK